jgi:hypothetical protein
MLPFTVVHRYQTTWRHIAEDRNPLLTVVRTSNLTLRLEAGHRISETLVVQFISRRSHLTETQTTLALNRYEDLKSFLYIVPEITSKQSHFTPLSLLKKIQVGLCDDHVVCVSPPLLTMND